MELISQLKKTQPYRQVTWDITGAWLKQVIFLFTRMPGGNLESEGSFEDRPLYHLTDKNKTDESTDAYDTIDWLIKNFKNNNGKAGIFGISYPG